MKFSDLSFQTQRSAPAEMRSTGHALLYRAGYLSRTGELLALGQAAANRLQREKFRYQGTVSEFFSSLGLSVVFSAGSGVTMALYQGGEQEVLFCPACGYADERSLALSRREPFSTEEPLPTEKVLTPGCSTIAQLAEFMGIAQEKTAKALMFTRIADGRLIFVVVRGDLQLSEQKLSGLVGPVRLASAEEIRAVGAVPGYASPVGLKDALVVVDHLVAVSPNLVAGANESGYHLKNTNYPRDYGADYIADVCQAEDGDACPQCGGALKGSNAAEVFSDSTFNYVNLLLALAEVHHDEKGLCLPAPAAPFDAYLMHVPGKTLDTAAVASELSGQLEAAGLEVLFDDRDERAGVKFNDADLIGCPVRVTVGERGLQNGQVEVKLRRESENKQVALAEVTALLQGAG